MASRGVTHTYPFTRTENKTIAQSGSGRGRPELQPPRTGRSLGMLRGTSQTTKTYRTSRTVRPLFRSATECDRRQVRSKRTEHTRRERKSGARNTYCEKEKEISLKKDRSNWKTKTTGETRQSFTEQSTNPEWGGMGEKRFGNFGSKQALGDS